ncbi:hypothetical protein RV10_GL001810 [Enterococcus pallens]|nr:hypothetical protein RV10_GL001810 [Enterococcus pallens]
MAFIAVMIIFKPPDKGKEDWRMPFPVGRIALPDVFNSV